MPRRNTSPPSSFDLSPDSKLSHFALSLPIFRCVKLPKFYANSVASTITMTNVVIIFDQYETDRTRTSTA